MAPSTIDAGIVTDLIGLAWENTYDVAVLVSSDKDFIPAVELLQTKNFKVINATWRGVGFELAKKCWASFEIDRLIADGVYIFAIPDVDDILLLVSSPYRLQAGAVWPALGLAGAAGSWLRVVGVA